MVDEQRVIVGPWGVGDRYRPLEVPLMNPDGTAYDLTGKHARLVLYTATGVLLNKRTGTSDTGILIPTPETDGVVRYYWQDGDLAAAGNYPGIVRVIHEDGGEETFMTLVVVVK